MRRRTLLLATAAASAGTVFAGPGRAFAVPAGTDHVILWNEALRYAFTRTDLAPGPLTRRAAILNAAIHDTIVSLTGSGTPYLGTVAREPHYTYDVVSNIDAAARTVLPQIFPTVDFTAYYQQAAKYKPIGSPGPEGFSASVGVTAAQRILAARSNDNANNNSAYVESTVPGQWRQTGSGPAATPNWGLVTPVVLACCAAAQSLAPCKLLLTRARKPRQHPSILLA